MTSIADPLSIGDIRLRNRLYRAPVLEGAAARPDIGREYARHFVPNARAGVALIIQGNSIVYPEGRTSPGMACIAGREDVLALAPMVEAVQREGAAIVAQLGHGGTFSVESWQAGWRDKRTHEPWAPSPLPWWMKAIHPGVGVMTLTQIEDMVDRFGQVARWFQEAGYNGVQLAGSNAKLLAQFLSPTWNRRKDRYGGSPEARFQLFADIRRSIADHCGKEWQVWLKYTAVEHTPFGLSQPLETGLLHARMAHEAGFGALTPVAANALPNTSISRGDFPAHSFEHPNVSRKLREAVGSSFRFQAVRLGMAAAARRYPFEAVWNREVFAAVANAVTLPVFAVGGIRTVDEANQILGSSSACMVGVGRPFYTEPDLPRRWLQASDGASVRAACESCNLCIVPQMLGLPGVCYNPSVQRANTSHAAE